ncbi:MAG: hypothetical protein A3H35_12710 [Betaproteobacteria bacterium RIFCSPLOWO2_02_FULL_62_17]|nr:MAG: hypothetical protein A3H35_12710 [Betaproteobacteria bacterium RIFCSPLOWO2_02_FULL_62_17]
MFLRRTLRILLVAALLLFPVRVVMGSDAPDISQPVILVAKRELRGSLFAATVLVVRPIENRGHIGFIVNFPTRTTLSEIFPGHEPSKQIAEPVYFGGTFATNQLFAIVEREKNPGGLSIALTDRLFAVFDAPTLDRIIEHESAHARFYFGICTWRSGQLAAEIAGGYWYVLEPRADIVLRKSTQDLWYELVNRLETAMRMI